jgi:hypothetical protein
MAKPKVIKSKVNLHEIVFDEELYPRSGYNWNTSYDYSQSMLAGAVFPPITLAILNGKKVLVDGKHRIEAYKGLKVTAIDALIYVGLNKKEIYKLAVQLNNTHGRSLSPYEKRKIALKLMEWKCKKSEISKLILVPENKLNNFVAQRLVSSLTGEPIDTESFEGTAREISQAVLKSGVKQYAGTQVSNTAFEYIQDNQKNINISSQQNLFTQVLNLLKHKLLDKKNKKVMALVKEVKKELRKY